MDNTCGDTKKLDLININVHLSRQYKVEGLMFIQGVQQTYATKDFPYSPNPLDSLFSSNNVVVSSFHP